jgi:multiple sugar transport system permease protein
MAATAPARRASGGYARSLARRDAMIGYLFIAPYLIVAGIFTFGLLIYAFSISFTDLRASFQQGSANFVGLGNYIRAFNDPDFINSLINVFWYALIVTTLQTIFSVIIAVLLNSKMRGTGFYRTAIYSPSVASSVVIALIFQYLFLRTGVINYVLGTNVSWLAEPSRLFDPLVRLFGGDPREAWRIVRGPSVAWMAIMTMNIFTTVPTFMVMFLAALQDIPGHLYEAAAIDGATGIRAFWNITVPLLRPVITLVVVLGTIGTFQIFDQVSILTQGGPLKTTQVPGYYIYQKTLGAATQAEAGYGAALAFILAGIIIVLTIIQRRYFDPDSTK